MLIQKFSISFQDDILHDCLASLILLLSWDCESRQPLIVASGTTKTAFKGRSDEEISDGTYFRFRCFDSNTNSLKLTQAIKKIFQNKIKPNQTNLHAFFFLKYSYN